MGRVRIVLRVLGENMSMGVTQRAVYSWSMHTLQDLEMWLFATITHSIPASTNTGITLSVNTISAGKKPVHRELDPQVPMCNVYTALLGSVSVTAI